MYYERRIESFEFIFNAHTDILITLKCNDIVVQSANIVFFITQGIKIDNFCMTGMVM